MSSRLTASDEIPITYYPSRLNSSYQDTWPSSSGGYQPTPSSSRQLTVNEIAPSAPKKSGYFEQWAGIGLGVANLFAEHLLSYPCIVLRRQCQINFDSRFYHPTPFTLLPVVFNLQQNQGFACFWKGVVSCMVVRGIGVATETVIADATGLPKDINRLSSLKKVGSHILLKSLAYSLTTSFAVASFVETVQSDVACQRPGILDTLREGVYRLTSDVIGPHDTRRVPIWFLVGPTVLFRLSHYFLSGVTHYAMLSSVRRQLLQKRQERRTTIFDNFFPDLFAAFTSHLLADAILFPAETVLHRLYLQGTRTIIDNLDSGNEVIPINTRYEGVIDCAQSIFKNEGILGFYKGFGALILQYTLHLAVLRLIRFVFEHLEQNVDTQKRQPM